MPLEKKTVRQGNGADYPEKGDEVTIEYTGWLYDQSKASNQNRGKQFVTSSRRGQALLTSPRFDSSVGRGDFKTAIGIGRVIKGTLFPVLIWSESMSNIGELTVFPQKVGTKVLLVCHWVRKAC